MTSARGLVLEVLSWLLLLMVGVDYEVFPSSDSSSCPRLNMLNSATCLISNTIMIQNPSAGRPYIVLIETLSGFLHIMFQNLKITTEMIVVTRHDSAMPSPTSVPRPHPHRLDHAERRMYGPRTRNGQRKGFMITLTRKVTLKLDTRNLYLHP